MVKCTGRGLVVKRPGVLSKVQMLNLVLGVGVFSLLSRLSFPATEPPDPRRVSEGVSEGVSQGFSKGFRRVSKGF